MINGKQILGLIPARGGSKGIPRKNIRPLSGKPLIAWTIDEAKESNYIDRLVVSTDDQDIADTARKYGSDVPFWRPPLLANDTARGVDVVIHSLSQLPEFDVVVLLQPTSPLRTARDIDGAIELWSQIELTVVSVTEATKTPYWMYTIEDDGSLQELLPKPKNAANRQDLPKAYALNGAVYVAERESVIEHESFLLSSTRAFVMPSERSIDLDSEMDWEYAEFMLERQSSLSDEGQR